jgi:hypothetical protein
MQSVLRWQGGKLVRKSALFHVVLTSDAIGWHYLVGTLQLRHGHWCS